jgi:hypothetical protein
MEDLQSSACLWCVRCAHHKTYNKKGGAIGFRAKYMKSVPLKLKKMASPKGQFWREHKKVVAPKKTGSSLKEPTWFVYEALLFLLQQNELRKSQYPH